MQHGNREVGFNELPIEVLLEIYSYLDTTDISSTSLVNKHSHQAATDNWLWMMKFQQHFPHLFIKFSDKKDINWFATFCHAHYDEYPGETERYQARSQKLFSLVKNGDRERLKKLKIKLKLNDLNRIDKNGICLLDWAKKKNNQSLLDYFYKLATTQYSDEQEKIDINGRTIFYWALTLRQDSEQISGLFLQGSKFDETYLPMQYRPIHIAVQEGNLDIVQLLIAYHPELLNQVDAHGQTPLIWAASKGHLDVVEYLLEQDGVNLDAASRGFTKKKTGYNGCTALHWAARHNHRDVATTLVKAGVSTTLTAGFMKFQPIHIAAQEGNLDIVQLLMTHHPKLLNQVDVHGQTPLIWAASKGHLDVVEYLLEKDGVNLDAASHGFREKKTGYNGCTALHWATRHSHRDVVAILIKAGATTTLTAGFMKFQPIHIAAGDGNVDIVQLLMTHYPELLNQVDAYGQTPLIWAASKGHLHVVEYLLEQDGVNLDIASRGFTAKEEASYNGYTALHWAACSGHIEIVKKLLKCNASPLLASEGGKTPDQISQNNYIKNLILLEKLIRRLPESEHGIIIEAKRKFFLFYSKEQVNISRVLTAAKALKKTVINGENIKLDDYIYELNHGKLGSIYYNLRYHLSTSVKLKNNSEVNTSAKIHRSHINNGH